MMFFMSKEGRQILVASNRQPTLKMRIVAEQFAMMFSLTSALTAIVGVREDNFDRPRTMRAQQRDYPNVILTNHQEGYAYLTEQYVTRDFARTELLKLAILVSQFEPKVLRRVGDRCKAAGHFNVSYLAGALEQEGGEMIEELRREERLDNKIAETVHPVLPSVRPGRVRERLEEVGHDREIDDALRGRKR